MSSRNKKDPVAKARAAAIKKPFPWGMVATVVALTVFLGGILGYAITQQGSGQATPLKSADESVAGVKITGDLSRAQHTAGPITYDQDPPVGGPHNAIWENCGVYTEQIPKEHAVHSLEHGAVWVTYRPDLPADQVKKLADKVEGDPYRMLSPYPGLKSAISLQAWGRQVTADAPDAGVVDDFLDAYTGGPQAPERGALCSSGVSQTGALPVSPAPAPAPSS